MRKYTLNETTKLYHLSMERMDGRVLYPRVPESRADDEDDVTKRVCFSTSIRGCVKAICADDIACSAYIYEPADISKIKDSIVVPSTDEVNDVKETREKWVTCPVEVKLIGVVRIIPGTGSKFKTKVTPVGETIITTDIYDHPVAFTNKFQADNYNLIVSDFKELQDDYLSLVMTYIDKYRLTELLTAFNHCLYIHQCHSHFQNCSVFIKCSSSDDITSILENKNHQFYKNLDILSKIPQFQCIAKLGKNIAEPLKYFYK